MARSIEEIEKETAFVEKDMFDLMKMGGPLSIVIDDLEELYRELSVAKEALKDAGD